MYRRMRHRLAIAAALLAVGVVAYAWWRAGAPRPPPLATHHALLEGPVSVAAEVRADEVWSARITVAGHGAEFVSESFGYGMEAETEASFVAGLRTLTGWKDGVLFVPHSCGGGNAWRCDLQIMYTIHDGALVELGAVLADLPGDAIGMRLVDGLIDDTFDVLESNSLTSHAGAPGFAIALRIAEGRLTVDTDLSWKMNEVVFNRNEALLTCGAPVAELGPGCVPQMDHEERVGLALFDAALARYCRREAELARSLEVARRSFSPEVFAAFEREVARVEPATPMRSFFRPVAAQDGRSIRNM